MKQGRRQEPSRPRLLNICYHPPRPEIIRVPQKFYYSCTKCPKMKKPAFCGLSKAISTFLILLILLLFLWWRGPELNWGHEDFQSLDYLSARPRQRAKLGGMTEILASFFVGRCWMMLGFFGLYGHSYGHSVSPFLPSTVQAIMTSS